MWWKVELDKGGKVAKCEPVLAPAKRGHSLRFVEADTREGAIEAVGQWYRRFREQQKLHQRRRTVKLRAKCLCTQCAKNPPVPGKDRCQGCLERKAQWRRDFAERGAPPRPKPDPVLVRARYDSLHGLNLHAPTVLKRFDLLGPKLFREWLVAMIDDSKAKARGETTEAAE